MGGNWFARARIFLLPVVLFCAMCAGAWSADAADNWVVGGAIVCAALAGWEALAGFTLWLPARGELALVLVAGLALALGSRNAAFAGSAVLLILFCMDSRSRRIPARLVLLVAALSAGVAVASAWLSPGVLGRLMNHGGAGGMLVLAGVWGASAAVFQRGMGWGTVAGFLPAAAFLCAAAALDLPVTTSVTVGTAAVVFVGLARTPRFMRRHWLRIMFMLGLCALGAVTGLTLSRTGGSVSQSPWHVPYWLETAAAVIFFPACLYGLARKVWRTMRPGFVVHAGCLAATAGFAVAALQGGLLTNPVAVGCAFLAATAAAWWEAPMAQTRGLHMRLDYGPVSCDLLGFGMRRLVAVGITLSLPKWGRWVAALLVAVCAAGLAWWGITPPGIR